MANGASLVETALESARERCEALAKEVEKYEQRKYPSPGPLILLNLVRNTNELIHRSLIRLSQDADLRSLLTPEQFALRVYRHTEFLPYLYSFLSFLQGAQIQDTPSTLIPSLRRFVRKCLSDSEVIFVSQPELNYSFMEIAGHVRRLYEATGDEEFKKLIRDFPSNFITITFPAVETNDVLLHCVIAHEIGHGIYVRDKIHEKLYPLLSIDQREIKTLADSLIQDLAKRAKDEKEGQLPLFPSEVQLRQALTKQINDAIVGWLEELTSDAIGLCLFGPAYYFAFSHFIVSFQYIDKTGATHPAPRLRLKLLADMLADADTATTLGYAAYFDQRLTTLHAAWKAEASVPTKSRDPLYRIASAAVSPILDKIASTAISCSKNLTFSVEHFKRTEDLCQLLVNLIPPVERIDARNRRAELTDLISVLNVAWQVYLSRMEEFCKNLRLNPNTDRSQCKDKLLGIVLKSAELLETKTRWDEVKHAIEGKRD